MQQLLMRARLWLTTKSSELRSRIEHVVDDIDEALRDDDATLEALNWALDAIEYGPPAPASGHVCGPESACDADCMDRAAYNDGLRKAYAAAGRPWPPRREAHDAPVR